MREADFQKRVIEMAERFGWRVYHFHDSRRQVKPGVFVGDKRAAGVPDLLMLHDDPPRLVLAEIKGTGGKLSDEQREFLTLARDVAEASRQHGSKTWHLSDERPLGVYVFTPDMEPAIEQLLRSKILT